MITELVILVEGVAMGRVYEQTDRGGTLSFRYDPGVHGGIVRYIGKR